MQDTNSPNLLYSPETFNPESNNEAIERRNSLSQIRYDENNQIDISPPSILHSSKGMSVRNSPKQDNIDLERQPRRSIT